MCILSSSRLKTGHLATIEDNVKIDAYARDGLLIGSRSRIGANTIVRSTAHLSVLGVGLNMGKKSGIGESGSVITLAWASMSVFMPRNMFFRTRTD
ncbi:MAG: hypothetical protein KJ804_10940 [Proteobacteria bacterium]|nr:hypothetical protein [Pseudomonadota bacterium]